MGEKTAGVGPFQIPTAPAALTAVAQSASANTLGSAVSFGNAPSAMLITGVYIGAATTQTPTYVQIQILAAASIVGSVLVPYGVSAAAAASVLTGYRAIWPPIPIANAAALTVKSASSVASAVAWGVSLECIATTNVVDDGVAQSSNVTQWNGAAVATPATSGIPDVNVKNINNVAAATPGAAGGLFIAGTNAATTVTTSFTTTFTGNLTGSVASVTGAVGSVTGLTASNLDTTVSSRMATYTQPTGFLAATFPTTVASTTNITSASGVSLAASQHVIVDSGTVTTLTNLPSIPANWITAAGITAGALNGKGDWPVGKTGYSLTTSDWAKAGDAMTLTVAYDAAKTALTVGGYTAPDNASVTAIKAKTDSLTFTVASKLDANILAVNGTTVNGSGTAISPWGP